MVSYDPTLTEPTPLTNTSLKTTANAPRLGLKALMMARELDSLAPKPLSLYFSGAYVELPSFFVSGFCGLSDLCLEIS
jgi:hypothetical protein